MLTDSFLKADDVVDQKEHERIGRRNKMSNRWRWSRMIICVVTALMIGTLLTFQLLKVYQQSHQKDKIVILPPRKLSSTSNTIYFIHVGKAGGTSIDSLMRTIVRNTKRRYVGGKHFDWSYIQEKEHKEAMAMEKMRIIKEAGEETNNDGNMTNHHDDNSNNNKNNNNTNDFTTHADVITFLRNPFARALSQFHFSKTLSWAKRSNDTWLHQTFDEYVTKVKPGDFLEPLENQHVGFMAGIYEPGGWIAAAGDEESLEQKRYLEQNKTAACLAAARNLDKTIWFGLMEEVDKSMQLLQVSMDLETIPRLPTRNSHKHPDEMSEETKLKLEKYIQQDLWLYEYAKRLFHARWDYFVATNSTSENEEEIRYIHPELPPLPDFTDEPSDGTDTV